MSYISKSSLFADRQTQCELLRQPCRPNLLLCWFHIILNTRNRQCVFFVFIENNTSPRITITRLTDGPHVHQHFRIRLDGLFADVIDIRQLLPAVDADQRRMAVAAEAERILLVFKI